MTDIPIQSLRAAVRQALEEGDTEFIQGLRADFADAGKLDRFQQAFQQAYDMYQAAHEIAEASRVKASVKVAGDQNKMAPSTEEVSVLYIPPKVEPVLGDDGSTVDSVVVSRWELDPATSRPVQVSETTEASQ